MNSRRDRAIGAGTQVATEVSINFGSSIAGLLIPVVGSVVVVAARQLVTAVAVLPFYRPRRAELTWRRLWPALALGVVLAAMNLSFYEAVGRLGLGIAATIEFLGPFALALVGSRRVLDGVCAVAAAAGVFLLTATEGALDPVGVVLALTAAAAWAAYILLTRRVATRLPGLEGLSVASVVATVLTVPVALVVIDYSRLDWGVLGLLLALGVLSSALPYSLDTFILRRISPRLYAIITSFGPVVATVFGVLVLHESFTLVQLVGIVIVCVAAGAAIATQRERPRSDLEAAAESIP
ncbi:EamA family transporter [Leifsonia aquatica]|uniref:Inner membrane transporter RhtA n=2 Tax=Leifsonia aquatica TaxID=144185 RepID=A0A7W4UUL0_LEIAQ|nr:EamA family transporter [Leifsonia aquatica]ERK72475.1 putative membrane protein [Leifsonia aquatica ATCC 14665]MBB2966599.1 inner membrane transporter RhtA [Leifsonia aquatica]